MDKYKGGQEAWSVPAACTVGCVLLDSRQSLTLRFL